MARYTLYCALILTALVGSMPTDARELPEQTMPPPGTIEVVPGEVIVGFAPGPAALAKQEMANAGYSFKSSLSLVSAEVWEFPKEWPVKDAIKAVKQLPGVVSIEPNYIFYPLAEPNDYYFKDQYALLQMDVVESWGMADSRDPVVVAVIDSGIDPDHNDLQGRTVPGWNFDEDDDDVTDYGGHGTMVSGVIAAITGNGMGIAGAVPNVKIMPLKRGYEDGFQADSIIAAMSWAGEHGAKVVNASFGSWSHSQMMREAIQKVQDEGILVVAAAGNNTHDNDGVYSATPASFNLANVVSVMATESHDLQKATSNYGAKHVDLGAPGEAIWTTLSSYAWGNPESGYGHSSGTSFSAPYVAGLAAILMQVYPTLGPRQIKLMILEGADPLHSLSGKCATSGRANYLRSLHVQPPKAISEDTTYDPSVDIPDDGSALLIDEALPAITVADDVFIRSVSVSVTIEHPRIEDLEISITSPDDITVRVLWPDGDSRYTEEAVCTWQSGQAYVFDTQFAYRGKTSDGDWKLTVKDLTSTNTGKLEAWSVEILTYDDSDAPKGGGGLLSTRGSSTAIRNCIFWGNTAPEGKGEQITVGGSDSFAIHGEEGPAGNGTQTQFNYTLAAGRCRRGSLSITAQGVVYPLTVTDDGEGALQDDGSGTVNYSTGAVAVTFSEAVAASEEIITDYNYEAGGARLLSAEGDEIARGDGTNKQFLQLKLRNRNVKPGSVLIEAQGIAGALQLFDDGNRSFSGDGQGSIDYAAGSLAIKFDEPVAENEPVQAQYEWRLIPSFVEIKYSTFEPSGVSVDPECALTTGTGNKDEDPLFADALSGDYHLSSKVGRWDPDDPSNVDGWVTDSSDSPCLDWGDHSMPVNEPDPNGFHVNMGAYGNTPEASMSKNWPIEGDATGDCRVNILDLIAVRGHIGQAPGTGDNWKYNVNGDGLINILDLIYVRSRLNTQCP